DAEKQAIEASRKADRDLSYLCYSEGKAGIHHMTDERRQAIKTAREAAEKAPFDYRNSLYRRLG
ncbi:hypothetical protein, partial [Streptomyces himastatinicus]|uniref:hypothetical protein n=1 Tax=Streptomyces himastatinicus TaxID=998084 RepID=UPI0001B4FC64